MDCTFAVLTPWEFMLSLEELCFSAQELQFEENILGLSKLPHLKCLFLRVQRVTPATSRWLAALSAHRCGVFLGMRLTATLDLTWLVTHGEFDPDD